MMAGMERKTPDAMENSLIAVFDAMSGQVAEFAERRGFDPI